MNIQLTWQALFLWVISAVRIFEATTRIWDVTAAFSCAIHSHKTAVQMHNTFWKMWFTQEEVFFRTVSMSRLIF